jgi:hypothetical protein
MKKKIKKRQTFEELDQMAHDTGDIKPLSPRLRAQWEAAKRTGARARSGRPRKSPALKARIVPISMDPALLEKVDRYTKAAGMTRSGLVAEALRMRMQEPTKQPKNTAG